MLRSFGQKQLAQGFWIDQEHVGVCYQARVLPARAIVQALQRHRFGRRSEQLDPDQLALETRGWEAEARRSVRQQRTKPLVDGVKAWLAIQLAAASRKSTIAKAIPYSLGRWGSPVRFLEDGRIEIDSNVVERPIRPIALNRKNALLSGCDGGGEHWAIPRLL